MTLIKCNHSFLVDPNHFEAKITKKPIQFDKIVKWCAETPDLTFSAEEISMLTSFLGPPWPNLNNQGENF